VKTGPAYLIFPIISLSPALTIAMSFLLLRERTGRLGMLGIAFALASLPLFDYSPASAAPWANGSGSRCWCWWPGVCRPTSSSWPTPR
jgi:hypothetical protein